MRIIIPDLIIDAEEEQHRRMNAEIIRRKATARHLNSIIEVKDNDCLVY